MINMLLSIFVVLVTSVTIWIAGDRFVESAQKIGSFLRISKSMRGATIDAIASSFPELAVSMIGVIIFHNFSVSIGTIVGSGLFNLAVIPFISIMLSSARFKMSKEVVYRDGLFYTFTIMVFFISLYYLREWNYLVGLGFIILYMIYIEEIVRQIRDFRMKHHFKENRVSIKMRKEVLWLSLSIAAITISGYYLVKHILILPELINIPPIFLSFLCYVFYF